MDRVHVGEAVSGSCGEQKSRGNKFSNVLYIVSLCSKYMRLCPSKCSRVLNFENLCSSWRLPELPRARLPRVCVCRCGCLCVFVCGGVCLSVCLSVVVPLVCVCLSVCLNTYVCMYVCVCVYNIYIYI